MPTKNLGRVSIVPNGTWNTNTVYNRLDAVVHDGSGWLAKKQNIGQMPVEGSDAWQLLAERGADGRQGVDGEPGKGFTIIGHFDTVESLESSVPTPEPGDAYSVGTVGPYDIYTYDGVSQVWFNNGQLQGPEGPQGPKGDTGETGPQGPAGADGSDANVTADNIKKALGYVPAMVNPNLLDNWYFGNPVNQRGKSEYSGNIYGIDRWQAVSAHNMAITADGLKITISSSATVNICLKQAIERFKDLAGKTVTISAVVVENTCNDSLQFRFNSIAAGNLSAGSTGLMTATYTIPTNITGLYIGFQTANRVNNDGNYFVIKAMKLELGTQQTLAHQENGVWVLNEIPDYGEQLRRCQRYCYVVDWSNVKYAGLYGYSHSYTEIRMFMPVPVPMRATPVLSNTNGNNWSVRGAEGTVTIDNISAWFASINGVIGLKFISSNLTTSTVYVATYSVEDALIFSADL